MSVLYRQHDRTAVLISALALAKTELEAMQMSAGWFYGGGAEAFKGGGGGGLSAKPRGTLCKDTLNLTANAIVSHGNATFKDGVLSADIFQTPSVSKTVSP